MFNKNDITEITGARSSLFYRWPVAIAVLLIGMAPGIARPSAQSEALSMAEQDWVAREQLPEAVQKQLPGYCWGTYLPPGIDWEANSSEFEEENPPVVGTAGYLEADPAGRVQLSGGVDFEQGPWRIHTESAWLDRNEQTLSLPGGVVMRSESLAMKGGRAEIDVAERRFELDEASFLIYERHARGSAESIRSGDDSTLVIAGGRYTTCPPGSEAWEMSASEMELNQQEGEGYARDLVLRVRDVPVFYFPVLAFPLDDRRRSGFLYPAITNSNVGRGIDLSLPYYFNLAPNYDLTYAPRYIHGRGLLSELEGRHLTPEMRSEARVGYINRDEYYRNNGGRDNHRWALDFVNNYAPAPELESRIDINAVSDSDYLSDLNRTLEINEESHIRRTWDVEYRGNFDFTSRVMAYQTIDDDIAEADRPYLLLPQLDFRWSGYYQGVSFEWQSEYTYFWRDNENLTGTDRVIGNRLRSRPSMALPLTSSWGYIVPKLMLDHTDYVLSDQLPSQPDHQGRTVPFASLDAGLYLDRQMHLFGRNYNQSLEPRLFFVRSQETFQDDLPNFDTSVATFSYNRLYKEDRFVGGDRVGDNNRMTLGFTTRLGELESGNEVLRASIGQIIYFDDQVIALDGEGAEDGSGSPFAGEVLWRPNNRLDAKIEGQWSAARGATDRGATTVSFHDPEYQSLLNVSHRYDTEDLEQAEISGLHEVTPSVSLVGRWLFDLVNHRTIGMLAGIEYSSCCWRVQFIARDALVDNSESNTGQLDRGYFLRFELRGLGSLSNQLEDVLGKEMRNFSEREAYRRERYSW